MAAWNDGVIADIPGTDQFHREATPIWLVTACELLGYRAPSLTRPFRYADLGCGTGFTALTVAAVCPHAEIWGFDFNPANIDIARRLAEQSGLTNAHFVEISFEALAATPADALPQFEFMIADGVLSVVSPETRRDVLSVIGGRLLPGGLACLGYKTGTGWSEFIPLQTLMHILYESGAEVSDLAVAGILDYLDTLRTGGAAYFQDNPVLERQLKDVRRRDPRDLAHVFLNRDWEPLMFADIADAMSEVKCDFLGRATLHENIAPSSVPSAMLPLLDEAASTRIRETMQDIAAATLYRRDIFLRGAVPMPVAAFQTAVESITVAGLNRETSLLPTWRGDLPADLELYGPLLQALREGPLSVGAARSLGVLADCPVEEAADAVAMLIAGGHAHPVMPAAVADEAAAASGRLNDALIASVSRGEEPGYLVSPVLGSAIAAGPLEMLLTGALIDGHDRNDAEGLTDAVLTAMRRGGRSVTRDGATVENEREAAAIIRETLIRLLERRIPLFRAAGILRG